MSTMMDAVYQRKLQEAKRLIDTHNYLRKPTLDDTRVVYEDFVSRLIEMGGTSVEMLMRVTADDLHEVCGLPILMARRLAEIFHEVVDPRAEITSALRKTTGSEVANGSV